MAKKIIRGQGITKSERYLASLGDKVFLRLWSYPNTFIDKKQGNKGDGKELADLLVVFGDDVIIFSDKEIKWPEIEDLNLAWSRWFRRAVENSGKQVQGAYRWLSKFEDRVFIDKKCEERLPIDLPPLERRRVHGIVIALGATDAAKRFFDDKRGTFMAVPSIKGKAHTDKSLEDYNPFCIGDINPNGPYVHVFGPTALDLIFSELDTIADFIDYITKREAFFRSGKLGLASGEEDLIASFIQNGTEQSERLFIPADMPDDLSEHTILIPPGEYEGFIRLPEYQRKLEADRPSYIWDKLIEVFITHIIAGTSVEIMNIPPSAKIAERALRIMASENRLYRRFLGEAIEGALKKAEDEQAIRFARNLVPDGNDREQKVGYVFLILACPPDSELENGYDQYREHRRAMLEVYCYNLFDMRPDLESVVGIAVDASEKVTGRAGGSEDLIALGKPDWSKEEVEWFNEGKSKYDLKQQKSLVKRKVTGHEFPLEGAPFVSRQQRRAAERKAVKERNRRRNMK